MNPIVRLWRAIWEFFAQSTETPAILMKNIEADMREKRARIDQANNANGDLKGKLNQLADQVNALKRQAADYQATVEAAIKQNNDEIGARYAQLLSDTEDQIKENEAQYANTKATYENFVKVIAEGISGLKDDAMRFQRLKAKVALSESQMQIASQIASSIPQLEGMIGGQASQDFAKLEEYAYKGSGRLEATKAVAEKLGSDIDVKLEAKKMRGKQMLDEYKAKMAATKSAEATVPAPSAATERQKIAN